MKPSLLMPVTSLDFFNIKMRSTINIINYNKFYKLINRKCFCILCSYFCSFTIESILLRLKEISLSVKDLIKLFKNFDHNFLWF